MSPLFQNANYVGINISAILYGFELIAYCVTIYTLSTKPQRGHSDPFYIVFSTLLLVLMTMLYSTNAIFGEEMYIVNAGYSGGMDAYLAAYVNVWYQTLGSSAPIVANLLGDALMIYRCYILYDSRFVVIVPSLIWVGTLVSGVLLLYASGNPNGNFFSGLAEKCGLAYYSTAITLNIATTALITVRLLWISDYMRKNLSRASSETYINAIAIIVESALPYTLCGIANLVTYALQSDVNVLFVAIYGMMTGLSPQLIIMRVARDRAVTREQVTALLNGSLVTFTVDGEPEPRGGPVVGSAVSSIMHLQTMSPTTYSTSQVGKA